VGAAGEEIIEIITETSKKGTKIKTVQMNFKKYSFETKILGNTILTFLSFQIKYSSLLTKKLNQL
jgi:hypothetical protein